jgi:dTMP kinase
MLVTISGIDGSGKTTQVNLLEQFLRASGRRTRSVWYRPGYSRTLDAVRSVVRRVRPSMLPTTGIERERAFARPGTSTAWVAMATADTFVQYAVKIRTLLLAGFVVLCDRYVHDALLDFRLRFPAFDTGGVETLLRLTPRPAAQFLIRLPWDHVEARLAAKAEPFPDPPALRRLRFEAYEQMIAGTKFQVIDGAQPLDQVQQNIRVALVSRGLL